MRYGIAGGFVLNTRDRLRKRNTTLARLRWGHGIGTVALQALRAYSDEFDFSIALGNLLLLDHGWYVTHSGLIRLARRKHCAGIRVLPVRQFCNSTTGRWTFKAIVHRSGACRGFAGYGDTDPSNVSPLVHGAEMRVAETRAVNRALRKAYGIGICSVEELGSSAALKESTQSKKPVQPVNGNHGGSKLRDRLCQLIRQH